MGFKATLAIHSWSEPSFYTSYLGMVKGSEISYR